MAILRQDVFIDDLKERLQKGSVEYGDRSFERTAYATVTEILEEQVDQVGWLFVLWCQAGDIWKGGDQKELRHEFIAWLYRERCVRAAVRGGWKELPERTYAHTLIVRLAVNLIEQREVLLGSLQNITDAMPDKGEPR